MTEKELLAARQSIVQKLTQARLEKGLSQEQLAKRIGTQRSNICRIEKGTQNLSLDLMLKIAEALDKDVSVMLEERSSTMEKVYSLRLYDETLLTFTLEERGLEGLQATILHTETAKQKLFPLDLELTNEGVVKWLERRVIPKNRQFVDEILKTLGLSVNNTKGIIDVCMGLSLNDSYWVVPADFEGKYADYNLYENRFSEALSLVAYTGVGGSREAFSTSPELTTNGMLRRLGGSWRMTASICIRAARRALRTPETSRTASIMPVRSQTKWASAAYSTIWKTGKVFLLPNAGCSQILIPLLSPSGVFSARRR